MLGTDSIANIVIDVVLGVGTLCLREPLSDPVIRALNSKLLLPSILSAVSVLTFGPGRFCRICSLRYRKEVSSLVGVEMSFLKYRLGASEGNFFKNVSSLLNCLPFVHYVACKQNLRFRIPADCYASGVQVSVELCLRSLRRKAS